MQARISPEVITTVSNSLVITQHIHSYETGPRSSQKVCRLGLESGRYESRHRAATQLQRSKGRGQPGESWLKSSSQVKQGRTPTEASQQFFLCNSCNQHTGLEQPAQLLERREMCSRPRCFGLAKTHMFFVTQPKSHYFLLLRFTTIYQVKSET